MEGSFDCNAYRKCSVLVANNDQEKPRSRINIRHGSEAIFDLKTGRDVFEVIYETCGTVIIALNVM